MAPDSAARRFLAALAGTTPAFTPNLSRDEPYGIPFRLLAALAGTTVAFLDATTPGAYMPTHKRRWAASPEKNPFSSLPRYPGSDAVPGGKGSLLSRLTGTVVATGLALGSVLVMLGLIAWAVFHKDTSASVAGGTNAPPTPTTPGSTDAPTSPSDGGGGSDSG